MVAIKNKNVEKKNLNEGGPAFNSANLIKAVLRQVNVGHMVHSAMLDKLAEHKFAMLIENLSFFFGQKAVNEMLRAAAVELLGQQHWERITKVTNESVPQMDLRTMVQRLASKGISQRKIAKTLGITQGYVSVILNGRRDARIKTAFKERHKLRSGRRSAATARGKRN